MKWLRIVFVATSIILSLVIVCAIINCEISYKYEIENRCGIKLISYGLRSAKRND